MGLDFIRLFNKKLEEKDIDWEVSALASPDGKLFSLGSDSKLIGRIFELISYNILQEIADVEWTDFISISTANSISRFYVNEK